MRTVAANVQRLTSWNRSMAVALERAENGSQAEDMYFREKLRKSAAILGYSLIHCKEPKQPSSPVPLHFGKEHQEAVAVTAFEQAINEGRLTENPQDNNYVGKYMYMGHYDGKDNFKNIHTRAYDV